MKTDTCPACRGAKTAKNRLPEGKTPPVHYSELEEGPCLYCNGTGIDPR